MASRILLADDSITIQKVVNLTFADEGIEVVAVSNGDQAERRLSEVNPDLVLADIFMPGKNGYELCEAIKENPQFANVPVVLLVGAFEPFDQAEAQRVRADAHLTKPFESRTLVETVRRLISSTPHRTAVPIVPTRDADVGHLEADDARPAGSTAMPLGAQFAGKLDLSAMTADSQHAPSFPAVRNTGELASPSPNPQPGGVNFGFADKPVADVVSEPLTDPIQRFEPLEFASNGDFSLTETESSFDLNMQEPLAPEMLQDFDTLAPLDPGAHPDPISFETDSIDFLDTPETSAESERRSWSNSGGHDTSRDEAWRTSIDNSPLSYQSPAFALQTETGFSESEASTETAVATLLAVDEPLGDVLFDEAASIAPLAPAEMLANDSLGLEFAETATTDVPMSGSTQFALVDLAEGEPSSPVEESSVKDNSPVEVAANTVVVAEAPAAAVEENAAAVYESTAALGEGTAPVVETPAEETAAAIETAPGVEDSSAGVGDLTVEETLALNDLSSAEIIPPEPHSASHDPGDLDWTTPQAASYSTAQLDSTVMPIDAAEYVAEGSTAGALPQVEKSEEATFNTPSMWTEEEARFTPIDIEAVAVKDVAAEELTSTGFEFSAIPDEQPVPDTGSPVNGRAEEHTNGAAAASLSQSSIEEMVRRMVAEMSESVVREVAWEVVPDCVERVIEQLTREALSKRA
jgi:CheY-like chemotaxis protein